jgi:hypothetical protein
MEKLKFGKLINKIHVGYPKTATTYLQKHIFTQLINHEFIDHPQFVQTGLFDLLWRSERAVNYEEIYSYYNNRSFFISFEEILGPTFQGSIIMDEMPLRLKKALKSDLKILITIRRQDSLIKSIYYQYIHLGGTLRLKNYLESNTYGHNRIELEAYNFLETYERYAEIFGKENITVIPYELLKADKSKFGKAIELFFENETLDFNYHKVENRSLGGAQLTVLRLLNHFLKTRISEKYIISPKLINQDMLRKKLQRSNFLRKGSSINEKEENLLKNLLKKYYTSNRDLDSKLGLNLKGFGYY